MSKLSDFLAREKIDTRRVLSASKELEQLRPEDRAVRLARRRVRGDGPTEADKEVAAKERRSGKAVTPPTLEAALEGKEVSRKARQRITAAVNHLLGKKSKNQVGVGDLFG